MSHPLLTEVLGRSWADAAPESFDDPVVSLIAAIPTDIADRLERALDECQYPECASLIPEWAIGHRGFRYVHNCDDPDGHQTTPKCHPYQPLVQP
jgi:hypothetical protein